MGALDGKHVAIQAPKKSGSTFYNYKNFHSMVLMAACDANYNFTWVDIGAAGRESDGGVFSNSDFGKYLELSSLNFPHPQPLNGTNIAVPFCFVGDEAFPLLPNLMRPYPGKSLPLHQQVFNYRLSRERRTVENTFGILASKWHIYKKRIIADVSTIRLIIMATLTT